MPSGGGTTEAAVEAVEAKRQPPPARDREVEAMDENRRFD